jgi:vacuolar-type H+-ATPase subunit H
MAKLIKAQPSAAVTVLKLHDIATQAREAVAAARAEAQQIVAEAQEQARSIAETARENG